MDRIAPPPASAGSSPTRPPAPPPAGGGHEQFPAPPEIPAPRRRRRPAWIALAVALVVLGALGAVWGFQVASERISVVGVAAPVEFGQLVQRGDLVEAQIVADPRLSPVPWSQVESLVGQRAATDLRPGGLVTTGSVTGQPVPGPGEDLVGVPVASTQVPASPLRPRDRVLLVPFAGDGAAGAEVADGSTVPATVHTVGPPNATGVRTVDVLVAAGRGAAVAELAAAQQLAIVVLTPEGG